MFSTTFASLVELVSSATFSTQVALRSPWHGPAHWRGVAHVGLVLDADGAQCDLAVMFAFAALHDTQRDNDNYDPGHGGRAAAIVRDRLANTEQLPLHPHQTSLLCEAIAHHNLGMTTPDPTIGTCWDADRLTLPRVGITVERELLSTKPARRLHAASTVTSLLGADGEVGAVLVDDAWGDLLSRYDRRAPIT